MNARPLIIDNFAGGGGASTGIARALGRAPDYAINHDGVALAMHRANHPESVHLENDVWGIDPVALCAGRSVGLAWFSPDCRHHSRAKGGKPREKSVRDLAWVVVKWARAVKPRVIILENVEEFQTWCPLLPDGKPDFSQSGVTFKAWLGALRTLGYKVEHRMLRACDYGAPTIRNRLFVVARCDGGPIVWPAPSHGAPDNAAVQAGRLKPWVSAAEIIDWDLPCPSIFDSAAEIKAKHGLRAQRPLKPATLARIAKGVQKYVIEAEAPFFITYGQHGGASRSGFQPLHTVTASRKDTNGVVVPRLTPIDDAAAARVAAFMAQHNGGAVGRRVDAPLSTLTARGTQQQIVAVHLMNMHGATRRGADMRAPHPTLTAGGNHSALVTAFLQSYYGNGTPDGVENPLRTVTTRDRHGLVRVTLKGPDGQKLGPFVITDIGMRMLTPREQFRAMGFEDEYRIEQDDQGRPFKKSDQTRMCGNAVSPHVAQALVAVNCRDLAAAERRRA